MDFTSGDKKLTTHHYFVDEAGDGNIFDKRGNIIIGTPGCSKFFILGLLDVPDPQSLRQRLIDLRIQLLSDTRFKNIPSMQKDQNKTYFSFHAKDDFPTVRDEVFKVIQEYQALRFFAVVRNKASVLEEVTHASQRYHPNILYDKMVSSLFKPLLQEDVDYTVTFAKRGKTDRTQILKESIQIAQERITKSRNISNEATIQLRSIDSADNENLQVTDYILWALQRLYERHEEQYITELLPICHLIHDVDDRREGVGGVYYDLKSPISLEKISQI